jgi:SP family facilitated glucose transporter-like MFS transporter 8
MLKTVELTVLKLCFSHRRVLLLVSCSFGMLSLLTLGLYFLLKEQLHHDVSAIGWLPLVCLIVYISTYCLGIGPLPWVVMSEVLPPNAKGWAGAIVSIVCWMTSFGLTNSFQMFIYYVGRYCIFWSFAIHAALAVAFTYYKVPETKGISLQEIQERLANPRRENINGSASL